MQFKNQNEKDSAAQILKDGMQTKFWKLICEALDESREELLKYQDSEEFRNLPADVYKLENELIRSKRVYLETLKKTPDNIISWLGKPNNNDENFDPYKTAKDV